MKRFLLLFIFLFCKLNGASEFDHSEFDHQFFIKNATDQEIKVLTYYKAVSTHNLGTNGNLVLPANAVGTVPLFFVSKINFINTRLYKINLLWFNIDKKNVEMSLKDIKTSDLRNKTFTINKTAENYEIKSDDGKVVSSVQDFFKVKKRVEEEVKVIPVLIWAGTILPENEEKK